MAPMHSKAVAKVVCQFFTNFEAGVSWIIVPVQISTDQVHWMQNCHSPFLKVAKLQIKFMKKGK